MKKTKIVLCFIFIVLPISICAKYYIELEPGISFLNMSDYNSNINNANQVNRALGYKSNLQKINFSFVPDINIGSLVETDLGLLGFYIKNSSLLNYGSGGEVQQADNSKIRTVTRNFTVFYSGLGARRYLLPEENAKINAYVGLDTGIYYSGNNSIKENTYYADGSEAYYENENWATLFGGGDIEAGFDWWYNDALGLNIKTGYRLGMGTATVNTHSDLQEYDGLQIKNNLDYSGFFITIGVTYGFGFAGPSERDIQFQVDEDKPFSETTAEFFNKGVRLFDKGDYEEAEKQFKSAKQLDPDNKQINRYLGILSNLKAESGKMNSIDQRNFIADNLKDAGNYKDALAKYKELLAIDPANEHALYYIKDFAEKAEKFKSQAKEEYDKGDLKAALQDVGKACDYAPDDTEAGEMKGKILKYFSDKKQADVLYNDGVENYQKGNYEKAFEQWEKVLEVTPEDQETKKNISIVKKKLAEKDKANGESVTAAMIDAKELLSKGMLNDAKNKYEYILRMDSGNTEAAQMIDNINEMENKNNNDDTVIKR